MVWGVTVRTGEPVWPEQLAWADLPAALAAVHLGTAVGDPVTFGFDAADYPPAAPPLLELLVGAGFVATRRTGRGSSLEVEAYRERTLPDFVGGGMRLLVCGLNPSLVATDAGFGYAGATNRFWPAAVAAGIVTVPRDPLTSLAVDRVGMTDLVKRASARADVLSPAEYRAGTERVRRLVAWLAPRAVVFVGLAGWRAAVDRRAVPGVQPGGFGGARAYVMPSTSGLNARSTPAELADHLRAALDLAG